MAVSLKTIVDIGEAKTIPDHRLVAADRRFPRTRLDLADDVERAQGAAGDEDCLGVGPVLRQGELDEAALRQTFRSLCDVSVEDDGLLFLADSVRVETIRDAMEYGGIRVTLLGDLSGAGDK